MGARARFLLVAVEVTLTLVLLVGGAVLLRSFVGVWRTDPGFEARPALTFFSVLSTPPGEQPDYTFHLRLLDELRLLPGVEAVGGTTHLPFSQWGYSRPVIAGESDAAPEDAPRIEARWITEDFLGAMGMRLIAGRAFARGDDADTERVIIVNEAFAARFFPDLADPSALLGESVDILTFGTPRERIPHRVIGVVGNVKHDRLFESDRPIMYTAFRQDATVYLRFVVRSIGDPLALVQAVRAAGATVDARQPLHELYTLETLISQSLTEERFYTQLLIVFGLFAFGLAAFGVYGSAAYAARLRLREIGIRIAFGAQPGAIRRLMVGQGLGPVAVGIVAGCAGAVPLVRGLESLLHGIAPLDLPGFAAGIGLFLVVAAVAALIPARRAAAVDPIEVLRAD
jgi:putative ABC transport system permease protein